MIKKPIKNPIHQRPKDSIIRVLKELRNILTEIAIIDNCLYAIVVFLLFAFIFGLVKIPWYYALIPLLIALIRTVTKSMKAANYRTVEEKFPSLNEKLRTVADNIEKDNEVLQELEKDVLLKVKDVKTSYFMPFGSLTKRLGTIVLLSYAIIFAAALNFHLFDFNEAVIKNGNMGFLKTGGYILADFSGNDSSIYGDPSLAELGPDEIQIQLSKDVSDIDLSQIEDVKEKEFKESYPSEVYAKTGSGYEDDIPKSYREIVRNYYTGITKER